MQVFRPLSYLSTTKLQTTVYYNAFSEELTVAILRLASEVATHIPKVQKTVLRIYWIIHRYHTVSMKIVLLIHSLCSKREKSIS